MKLLTVALASATMVVALRSIAPGAEPAAYARETNVTPLLTTQVDGAGRPLAYPSGTPEVTMLLVELPPGGQTGWHEHPVPAFAYVLDGELRVDVETGPSRTFKRGDAIAEGVDRLHDGVVVSPTPVKLLMFVIGAAGTPYAVRGERPDGSPPRADARRRAAGSER